MADAPKLLGTDTLRTAYPKINSAIDNANESLNKHAATDAKADQAISTSNTAKSTAETALTNSESTQAQLDAVVVDGDSSPQIAQALADTPYTTLRQKHDAVDAQLADVPQQNISLIPETLRKLQSGLNVLIEVVGDSITLGVGATNETNYVAEFAKKVAALYPNSTVIRHDGDGGVAPSTYQNQPITTFTPVTVQTGTNGQTIHIKKNGIGGDTVLMLGRRIDNFTTVYQGKKPDLVVFCVGVNDSLTNEAVRYVPANRYKYQLDGLIRNVKKRTGAEVVLMTPPSTYTPALADYAKAMQEVAKMNGLQVIEAYKMFADHYVQGAAYSGQGDWGADTWHPSALGHSKIGELLYKTLFVDNQKIVPLQDNKKTYWYDDSLFKYNPNWANNTVDNLGDGLNTYTEKAGSVGQTITFSVYANEIAILTHPNQDGGKFTYSIDGGSAVEVSIAVTHPTSRTNVTDTSSASMSAEKIVIATGLDNSLHTVVLTVTQNYMLFSGIEVVLKDSAKSPKPTKIMNSGTITITGTGTAFKLGVATFDTPHNATPRVIPTTEDVNFIAAVGARRTNSVDLYVSRKDGATFSSTVTVHYMSIDS